MDGSAHLFILCPQNTGFLAKTGHRIDGEAYPFILWQKNESRCPDNAYRADGARGQYIIIVPDSDAVIAVTANSANLQAEQDLIYKYLFPALAALK